MTNAEGMGPKQVHKFEQLQADWLNTVPPSLFSLFHRLCQEGFDPDRAFQLTRDYFSALQAATFAVMLGRRVGGDG